jgi:hypothetical protein
MNRDELMTMLAAQSDDMLDKYIRLVREQLAVNKPLTTPRLGELICVEAAHSTTPDTLPMALALVLATAVQRIALEPK